MIQVKSLGGTLLYARLLSGTIFHISISDRRCEERFLRRDK